MKNIYLDNAASTPMDADVVEYMIPLMRDLAGNPSSVHQHGRKLRNEIEKARKEIATTLGASPAEIFFTSGGTESDNMAICGAVKLGFTHIISSPIEHHAVLHTIDLLVREGRATVSWLSVDEKGNPDLGELEKALQENEKCLVTLMHANNEIGTKINLRQVGAICEKYDALFHTDAVQAMGKERYQLYDCPVHLISASAHKFYGPKGIGFIYVKGGVKLPSYILGGGQERNMRAGTENLPAICGMAFALKQLYTGFEDHLTHLQQLKDRMKARLESEVPGVRFNGETSAERSVPSVLNVCFPATGDEAMMLFNLDIAGISVSGGSACASGSVAGSHVVRGIGRSESEAANSIRFSFGKGNTIEEIDYAVEKVKECLAAVV